MRQLIVFSHLRWNFVYQRPQHVLSRLARHYQVLFIEEPLHVEGAARLDVSKPAANVQVLVPRTDVHAPAHHPDQLALVKPLLASYLEVNQLDDYAVWFYTPMALPLLDGLDPRAVIYDCMDELSAFKGAPPEMCRREADLMKRAEVVFTGGPSLYESKRRQHANVLCLPSAVDAHHYSPARALADLDAVEEAAALQKKVPHPRIGFFGVIDERMDLDLLAALADARPEWQVVMVGPVVKIDPASLPQRPNIHWLGQQSYELLPQLVASWDVCMLPFALNESTRFISPTKTLEYMAALKPVVSTPVRDVSVLYGEGVAVADTAEKFIEHCEAALAETPFKRAAREALMQSMVSRYSWDATASQMQQAIDLAIDDGLFAMRQAQQRPTSVLPRASVARNDEAVALAAMRVADATATSAARVPVSALKSVT
jgi:glycosyltransferase involved in cell wall biosynthesis